MKYIMFKRGDGIKFPIIFPETIQYCSVADAMISRHAITVYSAGKVNMNDGDNIFVHSNAVELGLKPSPDDETIITNSLKETDLK